MNAYCKGCIADNRWLLDEHVDLVMNDAESYMDEGYATTCDYCGECSAYDAWSWFDAALEHCPANQLAKFVRGHKPTQPRPEGMEPGTFAYRAEKLGNKTPQEKVTKFQTPSV